MQLSSLLLLTGTARLALAAYTLSDDYLQNGFFGNWDFFTGADPTHGYVTYVDQNTAQSNGYIKTNSDGSIYMGVDYTNVASGSGRNSVRISSQKTYTHYLAVIDLGHMPGGICGTWPAFWSFGNGGGGWPTEGEIDIIEGVNDQQYNAMTLHAGTTCSISSANSLVQPTSQDCNVYDNGNEGCSFHDSNTNSYGSQFNAQGGGTYATEWTSEGVSIWFWPAGGAPSDALGDSPDPSNWGMPTATWGGSGCDWDANFMDHNLVFDITFCGDWAGNTFQSCSAANGGQTCQAFVQNNPSAFQEAYWQINGLKVYEDNGLPAPATSSAAPVPQSTTIPVPQSTTAAVSSSAAQPTTFSPVIISEGSTGGIFLPNPTPSSELPQPTASAPVVTTPAVTTPTTAPPVVVVTTTIFWFENPTGGVYEPAPTDQPIMQNSDGEIYGPGQRRNIADSEAEANAKVERRRLAHLHRHAGRDGKF